MKLNYSEVIYRESDHTYWFGSLQLHGTSHLYGNHINPAKYEGIAPEVLKKAADRGTKVHEECEAYDRFGLAESVEAENWAKIRREQAIEILDNEFLVSDLTYYATKIDKVMIVGEEQEGLIDLGDVKTTSVLDKESLSWQLSVSAVLFELQNPHLKVRNLYGIWLRGNKKEFVPIERKSDKQVKALMDAEQFGLSFVEEKQELPIEIEITLQTVSKLERVIQEATDDLKKKQSDMDILKSYLIEQMSKSGVKKLEGDLVIVTYVEPYQKELFDTKKFKEEHPDLAEGYIKVSNVKESVKIRLK